VKLLDLYLRRREAGEMKNEYAAHSRLDARYDYDDDFLNLMSGFDPQSVYAYMHHYFHQRSPKFLREHRDYFSREGRGFGEDAFHAMWWLLFLSAKPVLMLEIGVYRGQTISLWALMSKYLNRDVEVHGISPFEPLGDSVSRYPQLSDYYGDVLASFRYWKLPEPRLVRGLSTDDQSLIRLRERPWDLIYVDGSHDYDVVRLDYQHCRDSLREGGLLVMDDASLFRRDFRPPRFAFAGHPGPSRVAVECAEKEMKFIGCVGHNNIFMKTGRTS
jgi:hypothetical protein